MATSASALCQRLGSSSATSYEVLNAQSIDYCMICCHREVSKSAVPALARRQERQCEPHDNATARYWLEDIQSSKPHRGPAFPSSEYYT